MQNFASRSMKRVLGGDGTIRLLPLWSLQSPYAVAYLGVAGLTFPLTPAGRDSGGVRVCCVIGLPGAPHIAHFAMCGSRHHRNASRSQANSMVTTLTICPKSSYPDR